MNEQQIELRLQALAGADTSIHAPQRLLEHAQMLENGQVPVRPVARTGPSRRGGLMLLATLAAAASIVLGVLVMNMNQSSVRLPAAAPSGSSFAAESWTRLHTFSGLGGASSFRQEGDLLVGIVSRQTTRSNATWGEWSGPESMVTFSRDGGRTWTTGAALTNPVEYLDTPPMDSDGQWNAVAVHGNRWVVVGGLHGAPAETAQHDGNKPVESIGMTWVSDDGVTWHEQESARLPGYEMTDVHSTATGFLATGFAPGTGMGVWSSADGTSWQPVPLPNTDDVTTLRTVLVTSSGAVVAVGTTGTPAWDPSGLVVLSSQDGLTWTRSARTITGAYVDVLAHETRGGWGVDALIFDKPLTEGVTRRAHIESAVDAEGSPRWLPNTQSFDWVFAAYALPQGFGRVSHEGATYGLVTAPEEEGSTSGSTQARPLLIGRTSDLGTWASAGVGPTGYPAAALATEDGLVALVIDGTASEPSGVSVWFAPWSSSAPVPSATATPLASPTPVPSATILQSPGPRGIALLQANLDGLSGWTLISETYPVAGESGSQTEIVAAPNRRVAVVGWCHGTGAIKLKLMDITNDGRMGDERLLGSWEGRCESLPTGMITEIDLGQLTPAGIMIDVTAPAGADYDLILQSTNQ